MSMPWAEAVRRMVHDPSVPSGLVSKMMSPPASLIDHQRWSVAL
jgi:hypothetical protein